MPAVQTQFNAFHDAIKLDMDNEKATLQDKRDTLIRALRDKLPAGVPSFTTFHQGSYAMHTGVFPRDGNYDIDVGVIFDCDKTKYSDPVELKKIVRDALDTHGRTVNIRRPCVTVNYMRGEEIAYHVDLVLYTKDSSGNLFIGKGKEHSKPEMRIWEDADPQGLTDFINNQFVDSADRAQFRRCVRYLKRWRDNKLSGGGVLSIVLTLSAVNWFKGKKSSSGTPLDLEAMIALTQGILNRFSEVNHFEGAHERMNVFLPVKPYDELTRKMTKVQMTNFKEALTALNQALVTAYDEVAPEEACKLLAKHFGEDFPIPEKSATAKAVQASAISTGNSA